MTELTYIRVRWLHSLSNEPIDLWSEVDACGEELRKIEIWADGRVGYASPDGEAGGTRLCEGPFPTLAEIAANPEFLPVEITQSEFGYFWAANVG